MSAYVLANKKVIQKKSDKSKNEKSKGLFMSLLLNRYILFFADHGGYMFADMEIHDKMQDHIHET